MIKFFYFFLWVIIFSLPNTLLGADLLHVSNRFPPHLMFLTPRPDSPNIPDKNHFQLGFGLDYSSVFVNDESKNWLAIIDMEMTTFEISMKYGLFKRFSLEMNLPWVSMNSGFLDNFLENYHNALGLPNYSREDRPSNDFAYKLEKNGQALFNAKDGGLHLSDMSLTAKYVLKDGLALAYTIKLPTGSNSKGFGSGRIDHGISLLSCFKLDPVKIYLNGGFIFLSDPDDMDISVKSLFSGLLGASYSFSSRLAFVGQLNYYTSPFDKHTGIAQLDDDSLELSFGLTWQMSPKTCFEMAFCEDLTRSAPDFTVHGAVSYDFEF